MTNEEFQAAREASGPGADHPRQATPGPDRPDHRHPATIIPNRAIFLIGRKKGAFLASGDSEAICSRAKYE